MRYRTEQHVPHGSPQLCYNHLPVERRTYRDALEDVGIPEHSHNADLRKSYGGKNELQHGETLAAYRTTGELRLSGYIIQSSKTNPRWKRWTTPKTWWWINLLLHLKTKSGCSRKLDPDLSYCLHKILDSVNFWIIEFNTVYKYPILSNYFFLYAREIPNPPHHLERENMNP